MEAANILLPKIVVYKAVIEVVILLIIILIFVCLKEDLKVLKAATARGVKYYINTFLKTLSSVMNLF